jgi:hypothetical protein
MRLIRGIPVPGSTSEPGSTTLIAATALGHLQATVTRGAMLTPVTSASPAPGCWAGRAINSLLFHDREGSGTARSTRSFTIIEILCE